MLRPATLADLPTLTALWSRPENAMALPPPEPGEAEETLREGNLLVWELDGHVAGLAALTVWNAAWGACSLKALVMDRPGQGEGRRFLDTLLEHVFETRRAHRLGLDVAYDRPRTLAFYTRAGFTLEGILREVWLRPDGRHCDCVFLGLLARDWRARRA